MDEKTNKLLERLRANGHNPKAIDGNTYRCAHCGGSMWATIIGPHLERCSRENAPGV